LAVLDFGARGTNDSVVNRAVFLDRDNTIIEAHGDLGDPERVRLIRGAAHAIASLRQLGFRIIVVCNQAAVARGIYTEEDVDAVHQRIAQLVHETAGGVIDRFYYCPFHPEGTVAEYRREHPWRKPKPGMLLQAARDLEIELSESWMVGDQERDIEAGLAAGCQTILVDRTGSRGRSTKSHFQVETLGEAAAVVAQHRTRPRAAGERRSGEGEREGEDARPMVVTRTRPLAAKRKEGVAVTSNANSVSNVDAAGPASSPPRSEAASTSASTGTSTSTDPSSTKARGDSDTAAAADSAADSDSQADADAGANADAAREADGADDAKLFETNRGSERERGSGSGAAAAATATATATAADDVDHAAPAEMEKEKGKEEERNADAEEPEAGPTSSIAAREAHAERRRALDVDMAHDSHDARDGESERDAQGRREAPSQSRDDAHDAPAPRDPEAEHAARSASEEPAATREESDRRSSESSSLTSSRPSSSSSSGSPSRSAPAARDRGEPTEMRFSMQPVQPDDESRTQSDERVPRLLMDLHAEVRSWRLSTREFTPMRLFACIGLVLILLGSVAAAVYLEGDQSLAWIGVAIVAQLTIIGALVLNPKS